MNIICPVDFSTTSVDAAKYATSLCGALGVNKLEIVHCITKSNRASIFKSVDESTIDRAEMDLQTLVEHLQTINDTISYRYRIFIKDPKEWLPVYIGDGGYDLVVVGTKGLSKVKDMTVGSLTESLFRSLAVPLLSIPEGISFRNPQRIVLTLDDQPLEDKSHLSVLFKIIQTFDSDLSLLHVRKPGTSDLDYTPDVHAVFGDVRHTLTTKYTRTSITSTIDDFCVHEDANILCMIHRDRGWMLNIFHKSMVKEELFHLRLPLLVLQD